MEKEVDISDIANVNKGIGLNAAIYHNIPRTTIQLPLKQDPKKVSF